MPEKQQLMAALINGFSKLSKEEKIDWIIVTYFQGENSVKDIVRQYWNADADLQKLHDEFTENTISNFYLPLGIAPNFVVNDKVYSLPMVIEESSVVAAAANSAKYWSTRGGFKTTILGTEKIGQVHFLYNGDKIKLQIFVDGLQDKFREASYEVTKNMVRRGGGILSIELRDRTTNLDHYYQLHCTFNTKNSMGANFINSCLEIFAKVLKEEATRYVAFNDEEKDIQIIMSILSNYVPNCLVRAEVSCRLDALSSKEIPDGRQFAEKFVQAVKIATIEPFRAVTHNKGIMNGVDAVVIATGNDFRAVEAGVHAYAAKDGKYASLSHAEISGDMFRFWMDLPLALGTVGGLTTLHPLVKFALHILENPSAEELMQIIAVAGLAQNFAALKSLTTTGIQQGHMKMHLGNILNQMQATESEREQVDVFFKGQTLSHSAVVDYLNEIRK